MVSWDIYLNNYLSKKGLSTTTNMLKFHNKGTRRTIPNFKQMHLLNDIWFYCHQYDL